MQKGKDKIIDRFKKIHGNIFNYDKVDYVNNRKKVIITCIKHNYEFKITPGHHLFGIGCPKCGGTYRRTNEEFINECNKIHNKKYDYSKTKFINTKTSIEIICITHGSFFQNAAHHLMGHGCSVCSQSSGETEVMKYLDSKSIKYVQQKTFTKCLSIKNKKLKFDFFIPEFNTCIEFDGQQHYKPYNYFGGITGFNDTKIRDKIKNNFCKINKIKLIRIKYNKSVETVLNKKLNK